MSLILPETILKYTKCSICNFYLSHGPTEVFPDKRVACGRCNYGDLGAPSLYNKIANLFLFPCVNRYEGCNKLLQYQEVAVHEKECKGNDYPCPICTLEKYPSSSLLSLIDHYNQEHAEYVLEKPNISMNLSSLKTNCHYLYCDNINNYLFLIYVEWDGKNIICNASVAGNKAKQVKQIVNGDNKRFCSNFNDHSEVFEINIEDLSPRKGIIILEFIFDILHIPILSLSSYGPSNLEEGNNHTENKWPEMFFNEEFFKIYNSDKYDINNYEFKLADNSVELVNTENECHIISIKCNFCENAFWDCKWNIQRHIYSCYYCDICQTCVSYGYTKCHIHTDQNDVFVPVARKKVYYMFFYCRNNCGIFLKFWQLREHEDTCFGVSEEKYVKRNFGIFRAEYEPNTYYIRGNIFKCSSSMDTLKNGRIYMITHDGFKCIISFFVFNSYLKFRALHDYDKLKLYTLFRIYENGCVREEVNNFSVQYIQKDNKYVTDCFFAVNFRKVNNEAKLVIAKD